jgi:hypothetical protein
LPPFSGHQPNQFQPPPSQPPPLAWMRRAPLPSTPSFSTRPTVATHFGFESHSLQPCADPLTSSPFQMMRRLPGGTTSTWAASDPQGGQRHPLVPKRTVPRAKAVANRLVLANLRCSGMGDSLRARRTAEPTEHRTTGPHSRYFGKARAQVGPGEGALSTDVMRVFAANRFLGAATDSGEFDANCPNNWAFHDKDSGHSRPGSRNCRNSTLTRRRSRAWQSTAFDPWGSGRVRRQRPDFRQSGHSPTMNSTRPTTAPLTRSLKPGVLSLRHSVRIGSNAHAVDAGRNHPLAELDVRASARHAQLCSARVEIVLQTVGSQRSNWVAAGPCASGVLSRSIPIDGLETPVSSGASGGPGAIDPTRLTRAGFRSSVRVNRGASPRG